MDTKSALRVAGFFLRTIQRRLELARDAPKLRQLFAELGAVQIMSGEFRRRFQATHPIFTSIPTAAFQEGMEKMEFGILLALTRESHDPLDWSGWRYNAMFRDAKADVTSSRNEALALRKLVEAGDRSTRRELPPAYTDKSNVSQQMTLFA